MSDTLKNIILIIIEVITCYTTLIILSRKYKFNGILIYGIISTFIACIVSLKKISIMNISVPTGFGIITSLVIAGNIIALKMGKEELKEFIAIILITTLVSSCFLNLSGILQSSNYNILANKSYDNIFRYNIRIYLALTISTIVAIYLSNKLYILLKRIQNKIFISNILSIIIVQFLSNIIFVLIAYLFEYKTVDLILCIVFKYIIQVIIGIIGTIPLYIENKNDY